MFNQIVNLSGGPVGYEYVDGQKHIRLKGHAYPWSIVLREFNFLHDIIVNNNLTRGYEACTGVGISGLAASLAMKKTGGKLVSLDAYVEEKLNISHYPEASRQLLENSDGYKSVFYLRETFGVEEQFIPEVGWTPDDVPSVIPKHFDQPLDYVFIDAGHWPENLINDIKAVMPYTNEKTFWLFHDADELLWNQDVVNFCKEHLGAELEIKCPASEGCCNLGLLVRK
jgi:hypothetical protein